MSSAEKKKDSQGKISPSPNQSTRVGAAAMHSGAEPAAIAALSLASFALLMLARRRRIPRFAGFDEAVPEATRQALEKHRWLPLRHKLLRRQLSPALLEGAFDDIIRTFTPQQVDYSNTAYGKDHWQLSCFMEYSNGVAAGKVNLQTGGALAAVCAPIIAQCDATFLEWYGAPRVGAQARPALRLLLTQVRAALSARQVQRATPFAQGHDAYALPAAELRHTVFILPRGRGVAWRGGAGSARRCRPGPRLVTAAPPRLVAGTPPRPTRHTCRDTSTARRWTAPWCWACPLTSASPAAGLRCGTARRRRRSSEQAPHRAPRCLHCLHCRAHHRPITVYLGLS